MTVYQNAVFYGSQVNANPGDSFYGCTFMNESVKPPPSTEEEGWEYNACTDQYEPKTWKAKLKHEVNEWCGNVLK